MGSRESRLRIFHPPPQWWRSRPYLPAWHLPASRSLLDSTRPDDFRGTVAQVVYEGPGDDSRSTGSILASERGGSPRESGKTVCVCAERSLGRPLFADLAPMNHSGPGVCGRQNKEPRKKEPVRPTTRPGRKFRARLPFLSRRNSPPFSAFFR